MDHEISKVDHREALYNDKAIGPIHKIQLPVERITTLHGIMFDLDPKILIPGNMIFPPAETPEEFYAAIKPIIDRHPLARTGEVRKSGTGLHLIVWMQPPIELRSAVDQHRWSAIVKAIQRTLPIDPDMPGITAVTRPIGSINSKSGAVVSRLVEGNAVPPEAVEQFYGALGRAPFQELAQVLFGERRVQPCPVCRREGTRLDALDWVGMCYGGCGQITPEPLMDAIYLPRAVTAMGTKAVGQPGQPLQISTDVGQQSEGGIGM